MNERDFAQKIARTLNAGLDQIDDSKLARLRAAREKAVANYQEPAPVAQAVTNTQLQTNTGQSLDAMGFIRKPLFWLPILAIVVAVISYQNTADDEIADQAGELDAQLLTGELPIDAFLDKEFGTWVKESSQ
jgi:Protein of unknown function (DUF3619)